jgi:DNA-binding NarL/FixJ family response regulator
LTIVSNPDFKIRVLVADTVAMSCHLLADALRRSKEYHAISATVPRKALELLARSQFDVVLIGVGGPADTMGSSSFMRQVRSLHPAVNVIVLLEARQRAVVVEALRCGARGIFCRSDSFAALCKCIRCVHAGQVWANSAELHFAIDALFEQGSKASHTLGSRLLSKREEQITQLVAEGYSNRQISERLDLSEHTIKNYLFRVFEKLGVTTRVGLTLYALNQNQALPPKLRSVRAFPISDSLLLPDENSDLSS